MSVNSKSYIQKYIWDFWSGPKNLAWMSFLILISHSESLEFIFLRFGLNSEFWVVILRSWMICFPLLWNAMTRNAYNFRMIIFKSCTLKVGVSVGSTENTEKSDKQELSTIPEMGYLPEPNITLTHSKLSSLTREELEHHFTKKDMANMSQPAHGHHVSLGSRLLPTPHYTGHSTHHPKRNDRHRHRPPHEDKSTQTYRDLNDTDDDMIKPEETQGASQNASMGEEAPTVKSEKSLTLLESTSSVSEASSVLENSLDLRTADDRKSGEKTINRTRNSHCCILTEFGFNVI